MHNFSRLKDLEVELVYELNSLLITKSISDCIKEKIIKIIERNIDEMLFDAELEELKSTLKTKLGSLLEKNSVDKITEEVEKTFYGEAVEVINKMLNA